MPRAQGYLRVEGPDGLIEEDTCKCNHCQRVFSIVRGRDFFTCRSCYAPICPKCANKPCDHFERKLARAEARDRFRREIATA